MDDPEDPRYTLSFDLLCHGLEVTTGGQRIHDCRMLLDKLAARGMSEEGLEQYLDTFRCGRPLCTPGISRDWSRKAGKEKDHGACNIG